MNFLTQILNRSKNIFSYFLLFLLFFSCQNDEDKSSFNYSFDNFECYLYDYDSNLSYTPKNFNTGGFNISITNNSDTICEVSDVCNIKLLNSNTTSSIHSLELSKINNSESIDDKFYISKNDTLNVYFEFNDLYLDNFIEYENFIKKLFHKSDFYKFSFDIKINNKINNLQFKLYNNKPILFYKNDTITNKYSKVKAISPPNRGNE